MKAHRVVVHPGLHRARPPLREQGFRPITTLPPQSSANSVREKQNSWAGSLCEPHLVIIGMLPVAIHVVFNLAPKLFRHECKIAVKNNFFSHLHDYFLPPIYRLSSCSVFLFIRIWTTLPPSQSCVCVCVLISHIHKSKKIRQSRKDASKQAGVN